MPIPRTQFCKKSFHVQVSIIVILRGNVVLLLKVFYSCSFKKVLVRWGLGVDAMLGCGVLFSCGLRLVDCRVSRGEVSSSPSVGRFIAATAASLNGVRCTNSFQKYTGYACRVLLIVVTTHRMRVMRALCSVVMSTSQNMFPESSTEARCPSIPAHQASGKWQMANGTEAAATDCATRRRLQSMFH
jgi:hypothetical protein